MASLCSHQCKGNARRQASIRASPKTAAFLLFFEKKRTFFLAAAARLDYIDASPEEEAIEVGDGEVRRPVAEPEVLARLQSDAMPMSQSNGAKELEQS